MASIGYFLSCEQFGPMELVEQARRAEQAGFERLWISDHFHPWNDEQGESPFVWSVIGAIAEATDLPVTTGVTCPTLRIHPAIMAQAAATSAAATSRGPSGPSWRSAWRSWRTGCTRACRPSSSR